eukprot:1721039-Rhodomonas_salina.2
MCVRSCTGPLTSRSQHPPTPQRLAQWIPTRAPSSAPRSRVPGAPGWSGCKVRVYHGAQAGCGTAAAARCPDRDTQ